MSKKLRTHYDNLQIAENASPEVIRGAYRYLSQKWHPDKNPNNYEQAVQNIKAIRSAYEVLSNPERRKKHDLWIIKNRQEPSQENINQTDIEEENEGNAVSRRLKIFLYDYITNPYFWLRVSNPYAWLLLAAVLSLLFSAIPFWANSEGFFSSIWRWPAGVLLVATTSIAAFALLVFVRWCFFKDQVDSFVWENWEAIAFFGIISSIYLSLFYFF